VVRRQGRLLLCATDDPSSPFSARVGGRSYIAVPTALWTDLRQVRMVVAHEGAHLRRRDHTAAFALELLKLAFFWNPAAHGWARLVHALQEIACDRAVSRRFGATAYGRCLLRAAELGRQPLYRLEGGLPMARGPGLLTRRVTMLMMGGRVTRRSAALALAVALVGVAALAGLARAAATAVADRRVDRTAVQAMADRLRAETGFAVPVDDWVTAKLNELVGPRRAWTRQAFDRLPPVRAEIEGQLAAAGLPQELLAVPFAESGFDAGAVSSHGSVGVWQLMAQTARRYGLQVSDTRDDRRTVGAATTAAAALLRDLHGTFGEWPLAIAAYNCGRGRALAAIDEVGSRDLATLARSGHLGQDARNGYVQTVLAAVLLLHDPRLMD
jgi:membrane-bound lytic murein transglycosylase D